jgi:hypothetical protein
VQAVGLCAGHMHGLSLVYEAHASASSPGVRPKRSAAPHATSANAPRWNNSIHSPRHACTSTGFIGIDPKQ